MKGKFIVYSLVAALVIVGCTFLVGIQFRVGYTNLIALATFCFAFFTYSLDHYFDALHAKDKDHLHQRHQVSDSAYKMTLKGLVLTALCSLYFFSFLPRMYLFTGVFIAILSGLYFLFILKFSLKAWHKQLISAFILTLVMTIWILIYPQDLIQSWTYILIVFLAVSSNLLTFGYTDQKYDILLNQKESKMSKKSLLIFLALATISIFVIGFFNGVGQTWMFVPLVYFLIIGLTSKRLLQNETLRIGLDLIMLLPLLKLFI
jgi:hypothetical protein